MPPRARKKKTAKSDLDRLNSLASKLGINVDNLLEEVPLTEVGTDAVIRYEIEAESVLFYIETRGKGFQQKVCAAKNCGRAFLHTFSAVAYCSDSCRAWALAEYGIIWNFHRKTLSERWNVRNKGYVPKVIGADATAALVEAGYVELTVEEREQELEDVDVYVPEVPYDPNFKLTDLRETQVDNTNEIEELKTRLQELTEDGGS